MISTLLDANLGFIILFLTIVFILQLIHILKDKFKAIQIIRLTKQIESEYQPNP